VYILSSSSAVMCTEVAVMNLLCAPLSPGSSPSHTVTVHCSKLFICYSFSKITPMKQSGHSSEKVKSRKLAIFTLYNRFHHIHRALRVLTTQSVNAYPPMTLRVLTAQTTSSRWTCTSEPITCYFKLLKAVAL
jgi:hypothetical protein